MSDRWASPRFGGGALGDGHQLRRHLDPRSVAGVDRAEAVAVLVEGVDPHAEGAEPCDHGWAGSCPASCRCCAPGRRCAPRRGSPMSTRTCSASASRSTATYSARPACSAYWFRIRRCASSGRRPSVWQSIDRVPRSSPLVVVERRDQQVHRVPRVGAVEGRQVGDPAPALVLGVEALGRGRTGTAPSPRRVELLHQLGDRGEGAEQDLAGLVVAGDRHHLQGARRRGRR